MHIFRVNSNFQTKINNHKNTQFKARFITKGVPTYDEQIKCIIKENCINNIIAKLKSEIGEVKNVVQKIIDKACEMELENLENFEDAITDKQGNDLIRHIFNLIEHPAIKKDHYKEMKMAPTLLELSKNEHGKYRFIKSEIDEITEVLNEYITEDNKYDIIQKLLKIGEDCDSRLTKFEIKRFFENTSGMTSDAQNNVIRFMRYCKEKISPNKKNLPNFEDIRKMYPKIEGTSDQEHELSLTLNYIYHHNEYNRKAIFREDLNPIKYVLNDTKNTINAIANCNEPEKLAQILRHIESPYRVLSIPNSFINISKLSNNNLILLDCLNKSFYASEIQQIEAKLMEQNSKGKLKKLINWEPKFLKQNLSDEKRIKILHSLGINEADMELCQLENSLLRTKIYSGNFEGGKRR